MAEPVYSGQRATRSATVAELTGPGSDFEIVEERVLGAPVPVFRHRYGSLGQLLARSAEYGERDYIVTAERRLSFDEHARRAASLARELRETYGVGKGDRVAIVAANSPEWIVTLWATVSLGAVAVAFNAWWSRREIAYAVRDSTPTVLVVDARRAALTDPAAVPEAGEVPVLTVEEDVPRLAGKHPAEPVAHCPAGEDDPAVIVYTSGTSGRPKGAVHSHRGLLAVANYHGLNDALARKLGDPVDPADRRHLLALPLFHIAGLHNLAVPRLAAGSAVVMHQGAFDVDAVLRLIERERVTNWGAVPTMAHRLIEHGDLSGYDLSSLTAFSLASAPSSPAFKERLREALPVARNSLVDSYGLTETGTAVATATADDLAASPSTLGYPIPLVQLEIRDPAGVPLPEGAEGEICVRSAFNMLGYWEDQEATDRAVRADRWLHTGDIGTLEAGRVRLTSRRSDLILRGGENVYPVEVENALGEHPAVRECIVVGAPHPDLGQEVGAVVVVHDGTPVSEAELTAYLREELAYYKVPSRWRISAEPLPRGASGKVTRGELTL